MLKRTISLSTLALAVVSLLSACGGLSSKQKTAASDALKALRKIDAAIQINSTYSQYSQLVLDAKTQVNEASSKLPDGELKKELDAAMQAYVDARDVWSSPNTDSLAAVKEPGISLSKKYNLNLTAVDSQARAIELQEAVDAQMPQYATWKDPNFRSEQRKKVVTQIWSVAQSHTNRASNLLGE